MLEFNNTTLANMTAALDHGCKSLHGGLDKADNRKRIGDAITDAARAGKHSLAQLIEVAEQEVVAIRGPKPTGILSWLTGR